MAEFSRLVGMCGEGKRGGGRVHIRVRYGLEGVEQCWSEWAMLHMWFRLESIA
jgi:hypothetical protein